MKAKKKIICCILGMVLALSIIRSGALDANASTWHEKRLKGLTRSVYYTNVNFLLNILKNGKGSSISTACSYDIPSSQQVTGSASSIKKRANACGKRVIKYIRQNHPELLSWSNLAAAPTYDYTYVGSRYTLRRITIYWVVSPAYMYGNNSYAINGSSLTAIRQALANADSVLNYYAHLPDAQKIKAYADWISENVVYDHAAYNDRSSYLRDYRPYDMISVFDNDPDTNVVCQGYTRAFQYLMDHSVFSDKTIRSKIVSSSDHTWNLVTIKKKNYFVDVTWYDKTGGSDGSGKNVDEFLLGSQKTLDQLKSGTFRQIVDGIPWKYPASNDHSYSKATREFFTSSELTVSKEPYDIYSDHSKGSGYYYNWKQYR